MTVAKEMNNGVALLLERMKTHPEEFVPEYDGGVTKWGNVIGQYRTYLTAEDSKALDDAWKETVVKAMQEKFTQVVLEELVNPMSERAKEAHAKELAKTNTLLNTVYAGNGGGQITAVSSAQQAIQAQQVQALQQALATQQAAQNQQNALGYGVGAQNLLRNIFGGNKG